MLMSEDKKICCNYEDDTPFWNGEPGFACGGCLNRVRAIQYNDSYVLKNGKVNCINYLPKKDGPCLLCKGMGTEVKKDKN